MLGTAAIGGTAGTARGGVPVTGGTVPDALIGGITDARAGSPVGTIVGEFARGAWQAEEVGRLMTGSRELAGV